MDKTVKKTVMILSAPIGSGHVRAALAMKEQLLKKGNINVVMGNIFDLVPGFFSKNLLRTYFFLLNNIPSSYDFLYKWGDTSNSFALRALVNRIFSMKGSSFLEESKPDAVITTHVTPAGIIALYKKQTGSQLPLFGIVTDYAMHKWWLYDEINGYIVFDKEMFHDYGKYLKEHQQVWDLGIPVHDDFTNGFSDKTMFREKLSLPPNALIGILSGGGEGFLPMKQIIECWQQANQEQKNIFFVAICGKNKVLYEELSKLKLPWLRVLGYIENISEYMKASDFIISKAGGVTITEAITLNLPVILYKPLPGQEYVNTKYLLQKGVAVKAENVQKLKEIIMQVFDDKIIFEKIKSAQKAIVKPDTAHNIVQKICDFQGWKL